MACAHSGEHFLLSGRSTSHPQGEHFPLTGGSTSHSWGRTSHPQEGVLPTHRKEHFPLTGRNTSHSQGEHFPPTGRNTFHSQREHFPPSGRSTSHPQEGTFPTLFPSQDRNSQSMTAKCTYPQAQASPQCLEHPEEKNSGRGINPSRKHPTAGCQSSPSPRRHALGPGFQGKT